MSFLVYPISSISFGPCAFENGPNTPVTTNYDLGYL